MFFIFTPRHAWSDIPLRQLPYLQRRNQRKLRYCLRSQPPPAARQGDRRAQWTMGGTCIEKYHQMHWLRRESHPTRIKNSTRMRRACSEYRPCLCFLTTLTNETIVHTPSAVSGSKASAIGPIPMGFFTDSSSSSCCCCCIVAKSPWMGMATAVTSTKHTHIRDSISMSALQVGLKADVISRWTFLAQQILQSDRYVIFSSLEELQTHF